MKSTRRFGSRGINFSAALVVTLLAHAALFWVLQLDAPAIRLTTPLAPMPDLLVNAAIVTTTNLQQPVLAKPSAASPAKALPPQANLDQALQAPSNAEAWLAKVAVPASVPATEPAPVPVPASKTQVIPPLQIPASIRLHYVVTKGSSSAQALLSWQNKPSMAGQIPTYELTLEASLGPLTLLKQTSTGEITQHGLVPVRYSDKRLRKSEQATHFDAAAGLVTFSNNRPQAAWAVGLQDRLSVLVQLAALAQGQADSKVTAKGWQVGDIIELPVASTEEQAPWQWEVQPLAQTQTQTETDPAGTIKLLRRPRNAFDASLELWLAPSIGFMPSRIRQTDSSGVTDQVLQQAQRP